jgi:class 3 adenylate cyclase/tetratricopeptide (TPR) repeat protein
MALHHYLPQDRLRALAEGRGLPERAEGAVLFADVSGFSALTEALAQRQGERGGAEAMSLAMGDVYERLVSAAERCGGSTVAFAGDAITCWFDAADDTRAGAPSAARAVRAALAMQAAMQAPGPPLPAPAQPLALKVSVASGAARRLAVGDPAIQTLDVLAGATVARAAMADALAQPGEVLLDAATAEALGAAALDRRVHPDGPVFALLDPTWQLAPAAPGAVPPAPPKLPSTETLRPWILPFVVERERSGQGLFVADLRPVVVLFLHFGGLGNAQGDLDDADVQRLDAWIAGAQRILRDQGGVLLELTLGDKGRYLYAAFGAAQAHEDDPQRALRAALALAALFADGPAGSGARIGLASGTLRVGGYGGRTRQSFGAQGDAVNAAARLMALARPGEILAAGRVRAATAQTFGFQARPPIALKGKAEPMPVFLLLGAKRPPPLPLQDRAFELPLVGREAALQQLEAALDRVDPPFDAAAAAPAGQACVLSVCADAGMGKSRLLAEGVHLALRRGFVCCAGSAADGGAAAPYGAWRGVWTALLHLQPLPATRGTPHPPGRGLEAALARLAPQHAEAWPLLGGVLGLELPDNDFTRHLAARDRKAVREAMLVEALGTAARDARADGGAGLLLMLDDLHAMDTLSLDLLVALLRSAADWPLLALLSQRPPLQAHEPDVAARLAARPEPTDDAAIPAPGVPLLGLELPGLDAAQTEQLIRAKLAALFPERSRAVPRALIQRVVERAQGNPFCIEELIDYLHDRGLDPHDEATALALDWPASMRRLVLARIDRLPPSQQLVLKLASVIGRPFELRELRACHPDAMAPEALRADLLELARLGLTPEVGGGPTLDADRAAQDERYAFRHRVTLEVAYDSIAQASRVRLHEQVAQQLEAAAESAAPGQAAALAQHWARAGRPDRAWPHLKRSAEQAAAHYANDEALAAYAQVLTWLPAQASDERIDVLQRCEALHDLRGDHPARRRLLAELDRLAAGLPPTEAARLRRHLALREAAVALDSGDSAGAARGAELALAGAARSDATHCIEAWLLLARALFASGRAEEARAPLERAREQATAHARPVADARALAQLGLVEWQTGRYDAAEGLLLAALPALRAAGELRRELDVLNNLGVVAKARARFAPAVAYYEQAQAIARRIGDRSGEAVLLNNIGSAALAAGQFHRAAQECERAAQIWSALGEPGQLGAALCNRAEAHRELGQYAAARTVGEQALALLRASGARRMAATVLENLGRIAAAEGDAPRAMQCYREALDLAREIGLRAIEASTLLDIGRWHSAAGGLADAQAALAESAGLMDEIGDPLGALEVLAARGELALRAGMPSPAEGTRAALALIEPLVARLLDSGGDETALAMGLHASAHRVLLAAQDARAATLLAEARRELRRRAAAIPDPAVRRDYLNLAEHRSLLAD